MYHVLGEDCKRGREGVENKMKCSGKKGLTMCDGVVHWSQVKREINWSLTMDATTIYQIAQAVLVPVAILIVLIGVSGR